jgi:hypothetical protein
MQEKDYSIFNGQCLSQNGPILMTAIVRRIRFLHLRRLLIISKCSNFFNGHTSSQKVPEFTMAMFVAKWSNINDGHSSSHKVSTFTTAIVYLKVFKFF